MTVGLANGRGFPLAGSGTATATFVIRAHPTFVVKAEVDLPAAIHGEEASLLAVRFTALPAAGGDSHSLSLAWRLSDLKTRRGLVAGTVSLGALEPAVASGTGFAPLVAPALRGTYRFEYELRERGLVAGGTASADLEILGPRSCLDDRDSVATVGPIICSGAPTGTSQPGAPGPTQSPSPR